MRSRLRSLRSASRFSSKWEQTIHLRSSRLPHHKSDFSSWCNKLRATPDKSRYLHKALILQQEILLRSEQERNLLRVVITTWIVQLKIMHSHRWEPGRLYRATASFSNRSKPLRWRRLQGISFSIHHPWHQIQQRCWACAKTTIRLRRRRPVKIEPWLVRTPPQETAQISAYRNNYQITLVWVQAGSSNASSAQIT